MKRIFLLVAIIALLNVIYAKATPKIAVSKIALSSTPGDYHDGMAIVSQKSGDGQPVLYGAIDMNGNLAVPYKFTKMSDYRDGVSIVTSEQGTGIINKKGQYVLEPNTNYSIRPQKISNSFQEDILICGLYSVYDASTKECGYFYQNQLVVPLTKEEGYRTSVFFPFISFQYQDKDSCRLINVETGERFIGRIDKQIDVVRIQYNDTKGKQIVRYFDADRGNELFLSTSSKYGVEIIEDEEGQNYIKNKSQTILKGEKWECITYGWVNNIAVFKNYPNFMAFNGQGNCIVDAQIKNTDENFVLSVYPSKKADGNGAIVHCCKALFSDDDITFYTTLYDGNGNKIYESTFANFLTDDWFYCIKDGKFEIVHTAPLKVYHICPDMTYNDGMIIVKEDNADHTYAIINTETGQKISCPQYKDIQPYNEGIAIARTQNWSKVAIDREGKVVIKDCSQYCIVSDQASNGVIAVRFSNGTYGYVYTNPSLNRNQDPFDKGLELFNQGKYSRAKNLFYNVMINDPSNVMAIVNYGACLERLGHYDGAIDACMTALKMDPGNKLAKENLEIAKSNKILAEEQQQQQAQQAEMFFDGLTQFLSILGESFSQYATFTNDMNDARSSGYSSSSDYSSAHNTKGQSPNENISKNRDARTYSDLESQLIKMNTYYNTYNDNQRRSIQSQMRSIRTKWEGRGYQMFHSSWEDWDGRKR